MRNYSSFGNARRAATSRRCCLRCEFISALKERSAGSQQLLYVTLKGAGIFKSDHFVTKDPLPIIEQSCRQSFDSPELSFDVIRRQRQGIMDSKPLRK